MFNTKEKAILLVMVTQWLGRLHKGKFDHSQILNLAEWMLWRIDNKQQEFKLETVLSLGMITLDEYVRGILENREGKRLKQIAEDWYESEDYGKYFGDFA